MLRISHFFTLVIFFLTASLPGAVSLPALFSDHMVLQRDRMIEIWGWAEPGEEVRIELGEDEIRLTTDESGRWSARMGPFSAGGPHTLTVSGENLLRIEDVLVGDVWLASGQSNMAFTLSGTDEGEAVVAGASHDKIRLFQTPRRSSLEPEEHTLGSWRRCTPDTAADFSAVAYYFAARLRKEVDVPIGVIESSWGGTQAEEWTAAAYLREREELLPILDRWRQMSPGAKNLFAGPSRVLFQIDDVRFLPQDPQHEPLLLDDFEDGDRITALFGEWLTSELLPYSRQQTTAEEAGENRYLQVDAFTIVGDPVRLQSDLSPSRVQNLSDYRALHARIRGEGFYRFHTLQPSIQDWDHYTNEWTALPKDWQEIEIPFSELSQAGWGKPRSLTERELSGILFEFQGARPTARPPSGLYNGMIHPHVPYPLRGFIWYQGEGNAGRAHQYRTLLPQMIRSWRASWQRDDLPFLIVQLPRFGKAGPRPLESAWAELREAQLMTARGVPHSGLAVTIDLGEPDDIHPTRKRPVGERLADLALGIEYERKQTYMGPLFQKMEIDDGQIRLSFDHRGSGLVAAGGIPLQGFHVAGEDRVFYPAEARIEGSHVVVTAEEVNQPVAVRYAWGNFPQVNLYNVEGYPAAPFRTDSWPGVTEENR